MFGIDSSYPAETMHRFSGLSVSPHRPPPLTPIEGCRTPRCRQPMSPVYDTQFLEQRHGLGYPWQDSLRADDVDKPHQGVSLNRHLDKQQPQGKC